MEDLEVIYRQYANAVYRYLFSLTRDQDISEELTQETFYQAVRCIDRYDGTSKMTTWLFAIAKNQFYTYLRKHPAYSELSEDTDTVMSAENEYIERDEKAELIKRVRHLRDPYRDVVSMRIYGDMSYREIGDILGRSENWVRVTFYRGKEMLRKEISSDEI